MIMDTKKIAGTAINAGLTLISILVVVAQLWLAGSLITSGVKAVSGACGSKYPADHLFSGDWFCTKDKAE